MIENVFLVTESEYHFLLVCPKYKDLRKKPKAIFFATGHH